MYSALASNTTKTLLSLCLAILGFPAITWACDVCKSNQPEVLKNVTHGAGPQSNWDFVIIWSAVLIVAITLFLSIKYLLRPNELASSHIKNIVVENI